MSHTALARKYRPTRFADLVGQEHVAAGLSGAVARNRVAHGYLLTGPRGVGKTTAARILAMALNCETAREESSGEPCGSCDSCKRIWAGSANLDVVEIDAASNRGVDDARELRERAMYAASGPERFKVYIIDEAHMLTREAWNALLKILEEPPSRVVFVFATTEPQKIANTSAAVISRLQRFDFRNIGPAAISARLRQVAEIEGIEVDDDALLLVSRVANGGMRDGLSMLEQTLVFGDGPVTAERVREALGLISDDSYGELLRIVAESRVGDVFPFVERIVDQGADLGEFVNGMAEALRALMVVKVGGEPTGLTTTARSAIEATVHHFEAGDVLRMLRLLADAEMNIRRSANQRLHVEALLMQWALMDRTVDLQAVLRGLGGEPPQTPRAERVSARSQATRVPATEGEPRSAAVDPNPAPVPVEERPFSTIDEVRQAWPAAVEAIGRERRMLRELLANASPAELADDCVTVVVLDEGALGAVERGRRTVESVLAGIAGRPIQVVFVTGRGVQTPEPEPRRQTAVGDRSARLDLYRGQDDSLNAMVDALDLELQE